MAKHRVKRYDDGGDVDLNAEMGAKYSSQAQDSEPTESTEMPAPKATSTPAKAKVVTKEQLAASGYDNLRDYMNAQQGLKRRDGSSPSKATPKAAPTTVTKEKTTVTKAPEREGGIGPYHMFSKSKVTDEGLAKMRAKDEAQRASFTSPMENLASVAKKLREKAGITTYKKGGMASASKRADGKITKGHTKCKVC
jgi:hypothetical protein